MLLPPAVLLASAIGLAVVSSPLGQMESVAHEVMDGPAYAALVLDGVVTPPVTSEQLRPSTPGVTLGIVSTVGAVVLAAVALRAVRLPAGLSSRTGAAVYGVASPLRRLHSGHIGDYAAWLLLGTVVFGCAYSFALRR
jgi:multicomponent Na+:H+ antiporter subunit D